MKSRKSELKQIKKIMIKIKKIKGILVQYDCGIFNTKNTAGDEMHTIFKGNYFTLDGCYKWGYYELYGTTEEEFEKIKMFYVKLYKKDNPLLSLGNIAEFVEKIIKESEEN